MRQPDRRGEQTPIAELVRRSQEGDRASFDALVHAHHTLAYNIAFRMLGDHDQAADATQAAFIRAYRALPRFRRAATFSTWLYRIAVNVCLDHLRHEGREAQSLTVVEEDEGKSLGEMEIPDASSDPAVSAEQRERQEVVQAGLARLRADHRAVLVMYDLSGLSYEEIAEALRLPLGTVKSRLNRARHALKDELAAHRELFGA